MRWLQLYLRARRVPLALALATAAITLVWALWMAYSNSPTINIRLTIVTSMLVVAAFGATLGGADDALDHTASISWPARRAAHVTVAAATVTGLLLVTAMTDARFEPVAIVLRNTTGLFGLTALSAALVGAARSWIAPLAWTLITLLPQIGPSERLEMQVAGWLIQPTDTTAAIICATVLAATGLLAYTVRGCPLRPAAETAPDQ